MPVADPLAGKPWEIRSGHVLEVLRELPAGIVQTVVTSPPYWGLRDYGTATWEGGDDPECDHKPGAAPRSDRPAGKLHGGHATVDAQDAGALRANTCRRCGAVRIEPTVWGGEDYCEHRWLVEGGEIEQGAKRSSATTTYTDGIARNVEEHKHHAEKRAITMGTCLDCGAWRGQLGHEATPDEFVSHLADVFDEVWRVLRDDGTLWLNIGDTYVSGTAANRVPTTTKGKHVPSSWSNRSQPTRQVRAQGDMKTKDLVGVPWLLAFELRRRGWYLRSEVIWHKPNPMPESVTDRPTKSHEQVFLMTKRPTYYYDDVATREATARPWGVETPSGWASGVPGGHDVMRGPGRYEKVAQDLERTGRNMRDVWTIATEPFPLAHFATYPRALVAPCILAGSSEQGACPECGRPLERQIEVAQVIVAERHNLGPRSGFDVARDLGQADSWEGSRYSKDGGWNEYPDTIKDVRTTGWARPCGHEASARALPCLVLDPFAGSGTTGAVARRLGRRFLGIELHPAFAVMAGQRIEEQGEGVRRRRDTDGTILWEQGTLV